MLNISSISSLISNTSGTGCSALNSLVDGASAMGWAADGSVVGRFSDDWADVDSWVAGMLGGRQACSSELKATDEAIGWEDTSRCVVCNDVGNEGVCMVDSLSVVDWKSDVGCMRECGAG